ncbi:hypothetical protein CCP3SC15_3210003 [Gammaproteobacteria bacterium]
MTVSQVCDFPFVQDLPKREQKRVLNMWDKLKELQRLTSMHGMLVPIPFAAKLLNVSGQRVHQMIAAEQLQVVDVDGHRFVTADSVAAHNAGGRKSGRPRKATPEDYGREARMRLDLLVATATEMSCSEGKK